MESEGREDKQGDVGEKNTICDDGDDYCLMRTIKKAIRTLEFMRDEDDDG